jgi:hypothetical protein
MINLEDQQTIESTRSPEGSADRKITLNFPKSLLDTNYLLIPNRPKLVGWLCSQ